MEGTLTESTGKFAGAGKQLELRLTGTNPYFMEATWTPDTYQRNPMTMLATAAMMIASQFTFPSSAMSARASTGYGRGTSISVRVPRC